MSEVSGNPCLFLLFRTCTMMLIVIGSGNIAAGITVCISADNFDWYNGGYIFLGFFVVLLAIFGHTTRTALAGLTFYIACLTAAFIGETGFTIGIIMYTDYEKLLGGEAYANIIRYSMLGASVLIFVSVIVGWCYRSSLKQALFYKSNENLINPQISNEPLGRTSIKREEIEKKYNIVRKSTSEG